MKKQRLNIGETIKRYRKVKGYSTQQLARLIGVSDGSINNIEHDKNGSVKLDTLLKIRETLDIPFEEFFKSKELKLDSLNIEDKIIQIKLKYSDIDNVNEIKEELAKVVSAYIELAALYKFNKRVAEITASLIVKNIECLKEFKNLTVD